MVCGLEPLEFSALRIPINEVNQVSGLESLSQAGGLLASLLSDDNYRPEEPKNLKDTGLTPPQVESLILKLLLALGSSSGREVASRICIPFGLLGDVFQGLRNRQLIINSGLAQLNDYYWQLTEEGQARAKVAMDSCSYVGPAPVPLADYVVSVEAQTVKGESIQRAALQKAFSDIHVEDDFFAVLGPAINSGAGLFLYGQPGNGKTTLAKRIPYAFGQDIWIPRCITEDGQIIKLYDEAFHELVAGEAGTLLSKLETDQRWVKIKRPTVIVGGELTMDNLEIQHDPVSKVCEAPLQLKSNCGCLLIDDFGRQRIQPDELLNRWIVPLENSIDYLKLPTGKKIEVPFEQLIIFSTNLDPKQLADEAFLRRIPYKVEVGDPSDAEYKLLFKIMSKKLNFEYKEEAVQYLIDTHYTAVGRPLRRCQPRDLLNQIKNYCNYQDLPMEMRNEYFDLAAKGYFTTVGS